MISYVFVSSLHTGTYLTMKEPVTKYSPVGAVLLTFFIHAGVSVHRWGARRGRGRRKMGTNDKPNEWPDSSLLV